MNLSEYLDYLGWSTAEFARKAVITRVTAARALRGEAVQPRIAQKIAAALSEAMDVKLLPGDIEGLNIERQ